MKKTTTNHLHRSAVLLGAAIIVTATLITVHGAGSKGTTKAEFSARQDFTWPHPFHIVQWGERFVDEGGNVHLKNRIWTAPFWYTIAGGEEIEVRVYTVYNSITDETGAGPKHGQMIVFTGGVDDVPTDETTLWEGNWHGKDIGGGAYLGKCQLQGHGDFAGTKIAAAIERCLDCGDSSIYFMTGHILYPNGE